MTNEELVIKIKAGETYLIEELWLQIDAFVKQQAYKFASSDRWSSICERAGITYEDLYVASYLALEPAIEGFDPENSALFLTYFGNYYLKRAFYKELGVRKTSAGQQFKADALSQAISLETQIYEGKDGGAITLEDNLQDESAQEPFTQIEETLYNDCLRRDIEEALASLDQRDADIIRDHYFNLLSPDAQAKKYAISRGRVNDIRFRALNILSRHKVLQAYRADLMSSTSFTGYKAWKETGMSQQERIVLKLEEYEQRLKLKG